MSEAQLKTFEQSYKEKVKFGKLVYSKKLKEKTTKLILQSLE